jgi:hypothetical protein
MKGIIGRVFPKKGGLLAGGDMPNHSALSSELTHSDIEHYYLRIIVDVMRRILVPADSVEIGVRRAGTGPNGLVAFAGYIRILRWDPIMPVLLQNLPVLDGRIRKVVAASVILEHTHFEGLWLQAQCTTEGAPQELVGMPAELLRHPKPI